MTLTPGAHTRHRTRAPFVLPLYSPLQVRALSSLSGVCAHCTGVCGAWRRQVSTNPYMMAGDWHDTIHLFPYETHDPLYTPTARHSGDRRRRGAAALPAAEHGRMLMDGGRGTRLTTGAGNSSNATRGVEKVLGPGLTVRFQTDAFTGIVPYHCHYQEHNDYGMLATFAVTGTEGAFVDPDRLSGSCYRTTPTCFAAAAAHD